MENWTKQSDAAHESAKAGAVDRVKKLMVDGIYRLYLAGPMTGHREYNYPAFFEAEDRLLRMGLVPLNPARSFDGDTSRPRADYIRADLNFLRVCHAIAVLPRWRMSRGARLEVAIGYELGLPILDAETLLPVDRAALEVVEVDREEPLIEAVEAFVRDWDCIGCMDGATEALANLLRLAAEARGGMATAMDAACRHAAESGVEAVAQGRIMDAVEKGAAA